MSESTRTGTARAGARKERGLRVLILDPQPHLRQRLKETMRGLDFVEAIHERGSPHGLLEIVGEHHIDVIMVDVNPGVASAPEIVRMVRSKTGERLGFVLMGEGLTREAVEQGRKVGVQSFLSVPYDLGTLEKALKAARPRAAPPGAAGGAPGPSGALRETLDKLRQVSLFSGFSDSELVRLLKICKTRNFPAGNYVFRDGDRGDSLYVIVSGQLEIRKRIDGEDKVLVNMRPGDCFGEMAIIDTAPRSADAYAPTACTVIEVNESVVNNNEDLLSLKLVRQIAILLARKLRAQSK